MERLIWTQGYKMSTKRNSSTDQGFPHSYAQNTSFRKSSSPEYSPDHVEIYKGSVEKSDLEEFLDFCDSSRDLTGYDIEEPEIQVDWYSSKENKENSSRLETTIERKYVSEKIPERYAETVSKMPLARDFLYNETVEYEEVENIKWDEALEKLEEAGIKSSKNEI